MKNLHAASPGSVDGPLVTIAIPTFNRAHWVKECVLSALSQTYVNFEVVVSDNASTDATADVLASLAGPRLRVIQQERNLGLIPNWNACLAEARGDYIVFLPDDDRIAPWLLERCVAQIVSAPQVSIVFALGDAYFAADGRVRPTVPNPKLATGVYDGVDILLEYLDGRISAQGCTILLRTDRLRAGGGFPSGWPHTGDLARQLPMLLTGDAGFVNECCGTYFVHDETETSKLDIDSRVGDIRRLAHLIIATADETVTDAQKRREIESHARHYLAINTLGHIASTRRAGAGMADAFRLIWRWRDDLAHLRLGDAFTLARPLALLALPGPVIRFVRRGIRALRRPGPGSSEERKPSSPANQ